MREQPGRDGLSHYLAHRGEYRRSYRKQQDFVGATVPVAISQVADMDAGSSPAAMASPITLLIAASIAAPTRL